MVREIHNKVKGRIRFAIKGLYRCEELKSRLELSLARGPDVVFASANVLTGNLLVLFDPGCNNKLITELVSEITLAHYKHLCQDDCKPAPATISRRKRTGSKPKRSLSRPAPAQIDSVCRHVMEVDDIAKELGNSPGIGLLPDDVGRNRALYGSNILPEAEPRSSLDIIFAQCNTVPFALLGVAAGISILAGGLADALVIGGVLVVNTVIGYVTESAAERTIHSLRSRANPVATLIRDGDIQEVPADRIVVGDLLVLRPGAFVAADARIAEASDLSVDESLLTGESMPAKKRPEVLTDPHCPLSDRTNMVFSGTIVTGGHGLAIVVAVGLSSEVGRIRSLLVESGPPQTLLGRQIATISNQLIVISLAVCGVVFVVGILRGSTFFEMLKTTISLAVAAVPEGLPTVATTTLACGVTRMRRHKVLIRNLEAICTMGSLQTICFDKTGTVTLNQMSVTLVYAGMKKIEFNGGIMTGSDGPTYPGRYEEVTRLLQVCALCNESEIAGTNGTQVLTGSPTENALVAMALSAGMDVQGLRSNYPRLDTSYRSEAHQFMTSVHRGDTGVLLALKGSPLEVLSKCTHQVRNGETVPITEEDRDAIEAYNDHMAGDALRVLGCAFAENGHIDDPQPDDSFTWLGLVGLSDPLRAEAKDSVQLFHKAGIETVMITGDQASTAYAVGRALALNNGDRLEILDSTALSMADPEVLKAICRNVHVFSRVSPSDKLKIVQSLQGAGKIVAMTGDGVNDGPALRAADIGIAMGRSGTDVAREVADVILEDDNLETLALAISDGRTIYHNIRKTLHYLLATNLSEIEVMLIGGALGIGYPLNPMQLLWINLVSDIFPGLALTFDPKEPDVMEHPPGDPNEPIVAREDYKRITFEATVLSVSSMAAYAWGIMRYGIGPQAGTLAFHSLSASQVLHALSCRSKQRSSLAEATSNGLLTTGVAVSLGLQVMSHLVPGLRGLLGLSAMTFSDTLVVGAASVVPLLISESTKQERVNVQSDRLPAGRAR